MARVTVQADCGNAPKKEFLRDFEIAFTDKDSKKILDFFADNIYWEIVGENVIKGMTEATKMVETMMDGTISELTIETIITHGDTGAVNGTMKFTNEKIYGFCDVFTFTSHAKDAKIKKLTSYVVELRD